MDFGQDSRSDLQSWVAKSTEKEYDEADENEDNE